MSLILYSFNIFVLDWILFPYVLSRLLFGWALGMTSTALIVHWGQAGETLAWATPFFIQAFAAVFYPVDVLPEKVQWFSRVLPCSHIFEGMRELLREGSAPARYWLLASGFNVLFL